MNNLSIFAAKSCSEDHTKRLTFKTHSLDTAGIMQNLFRCWLPQSVRELLIDNLYGENQNLNEYEKETLTRNCCTLVALLHDIGKLTPAFQSRIVHNIDDYNELLLQKGFNISKIDNASASPHNIAGQCILEDYGFSKDIAIIIGSHHGRPAHVGTLSVTNQIKDITYQYNYFGYDCLQEDKWRTIWQEWINFSLETTGFHSISDLPKPNIKAQFILCGLLIMSDWIASNINYFPYLNMNDSLTDNEQKLRVKEAYKKLGLPEYIELQNIYDAESLFTERFNFIPNQVQLEILDIVSSLNQPEILILEASMGTGKTEAALAAAELFMRKFHKSGIFFGLPTQATANGIFSRINQWAKGLVDDETHTIRLAHGMVELNEDYQSLFHGKASDSGDENIIVHEWFEGRKQALLSDFVIATVDQILMAALKQKHVMLRHLGLAGKVVIIDECHAYDAYMNVYLDSALRWMGAYGVPVIILSATLPAQRCKELINTYRSSRNKEKLEDFILNENDYPKITYTHNNYVETRVINLNEKPKCVNILSIDEVNLATELSNKLQSGGCAAVIVNTVRYAQKLYDTLSKELSDCEVICFHSRFVATDRAEIEKILLKRVGKASTEKERNKLVVVATQVLEQSLDLDIDFMITELCPMDLLLQRIGRLHRHFRKRPDNLKIPQVALLNPTEQKNHSIYSEWILKRTRQFLPDQFVLPECIPHLVNAVYAEPQEKELNSTNTNDYEEYKRILSDKESNAEKYNMEFEEDEFNTMIDILNNDVGNDTKAKATVRDSKETIEVIVLQTGLNGNYRFLPWYNSGKELDTSYSLDEQDCIAIARERLTLPLSFSLTDKLFKQTENELTSMPTRWSESSLLKGELLLIFDENFIVKLCNKILCYDKQKGLYILEE